jgi:hypothetical protein
VIEDVDLRFVAAVRVEVVSDLRGLPLPGPEFVVEEVEVEGRGGLKGLGAIF